MDFEVPVLPHVYEAVQNLDIKALSKLSHRELRPILPCLSRMCLLPPLENSQKFLDDRKELTSLISGIECVNSIVGLLSIDFHSLEVDLKKEQQLRQRPATYESILVPSLQGSMSLEFERSDCTRRLRLVLYELLSVIPLTQEKKETTSIIIRNSEIFDQAVYLEKAADVLCVALAELPALLNAADIAEALLHLKYGPWLICRIVANAPDTFRDVYTSLISNGEKQEEDGTSTSIRMKALNILCNMNPAQALIIRSKCVDLLRMPALAVLLSLENRSEQDDLVAFITGLLLGNDQNVRNWFSQFVRNGQKRRVESQASLQALRCELLKKLRTVLQITENQDEENMMMVDETSNVQTLTGDKVIQASALLRLYCALRGVAGIKFQEEEVNLIVRLITSHPPPSPAGVHFVSLGLCMLIACPTLISQPEHEKRSVDWVKWLINEEAYFESASGVTASFGEMLLLMAIHFHSNQLSAICDLVCATLGMKIAIRHNTLSRLKTIFVQEIFTEQVVAAHAVKVLVTPHLNANMSGFLPVHCIHQLLKSRAFSKHKVPIKDWIYRQILYCEVPLHSVMPVLIDVYVGSILVPASRQSSNDGNIPATNEPISEQEIVDVFRNFSFQDKSKKSRGDLPPSSLTPQLLLLYYVLQYEDLRLNTTPNLQVMRPPKAYSSDFLADIPIKYLLQQAQKHQQHFSGIFPPLLRLLATQFPHLALVDDWFTNEERSTYIDLYKKPLTTQDIEQAFNEVTDCPARLIFVLKKLSEIPATDAWEHSKIFTSYIKSILSDQIPRHVQDLYYAVWLRLNTVLPRSLWVMTVNSLMLPDPTSNSKTPLIELTQEDLVMDPLQVLRCDERVFRCAPALSIVLRVLQASLAASRFDYARQIQDRIVSGPQITNYEIKEREDLRNAIVATQESTAVQILLEACLETKEDKINPGQQWALRECRGVICSYLHQVFIADPSMAKLVHFQGYPMELLPVTVNGIPSMHICLDFLPELLSQPAADKQVFAVNLASHLALQFALIRSLGVARLVINTLSVLLSVLPANERATFFSATLAALTRISEAFPVLIDEIVAFLVQLGRVSVSQASLDGHYCSNKAINNIDGNGTHNCLCVQVEKTYKIIMEKAVLKSSIYSGRTVDL